MKLNIDMSAFLFAPYAFQVFTFISSKYLVLLKFLLSSNLCELFCPPFSFYKDGGILYVFKQLIYFYQIVTDGIG